MVPSPLHALPRDRLLLGYRLSPWAPGCSAPFLGRFCPWLRHPWNALHAHEETVCPGLLPHLCPAGVTSRFLARLPLGVYREGPVPPRVPVDAHEGTGGVDGADRLTEVGLHQPVKGRATK